MNQQNGGRENVFKVNPKMAMRQVLIPAAQWEQSINSSRIEMR